MTLTLLLEATLQTLLMVGLSTALGLLFGVPLAIVLFITAPGGLNESPWVYRPLNAIINALRSLPYIILMVGLLPITRWMVGTSVGTLAATVPLSLAAMLLIARVGFNAFQSLPKGLIEAALSMGATRKQIVTRVVLPETLSTLSSGVLLIIVNLIGFSAMAGAVGGGGLGDLAIRYGYQRYDLTTLLAVSAVLLVLVQLVQSGGERWIRLRGASAP